MATTTPECLIRVRLNFPTLDEFVRRFAVNVNRTGMFVPSREPHAVGSIIRFEFVLADGQIALSGEGSVTWVREFDPAETTRPHGMGIKFTTLAEASHPVLERLVEQRKAAKQMQRPAERPAERQPPSDPPIGGSEPSDADKRPSASERPLVAVAEVPAGASGTPSAAASVEASSAASVQEADRGDPQTGPAPSDADAAPEKQEPPPTARSTSAPAEPRRPSLPQTTSSESASRGAPGRPDRRGRALVWTVAVLGGSALAAFLLARDPVRDVPSIARETGVPPPLAVIAPPPVRSGQTNESAAELIATTAPAPRPADDRPPSADAAKEPPPESAEAKKPVARTRKSPVQIESILTGPTYERYTCPGPTGHFSVKSHRRVNVCIRIAAMHEPVAADLTVVWERNGATVCRIPLPVSGRHISSRTRAHIAINERRTGQWSVSIQSSEGVELARSSFQVDP